MKADWQNHHIEGYAHAAYVRGIDSHFSAPLISHVVDGLWQGGCINDVTLDPDFDLVISLYPWEKYKLGENTERVEIEAYDSPDQDPELFHEVAQKAAEAVLKGQKVLVHCQAGLNRSGVVGALTLIHMGYTAADAVALLRNSRSPLVLCNQAFERWVLQQ